MVWCGRLEVAGSWVGGPQIDELGNGNGPCAGVPVVCEFGAA